MILDQHSVCISNLGYFLARFIDELFSILIYYLMPCLFAAASSSTFAISLTMLTNSLLSKMYMYDLCYYHFVGSLWFLCSADGTLVWILFWLLSFKVINLPWPLSVIVNCRGPNFLFASSQSKVFCCSLISFHPQYWQSYSTQIRPSLRVYICLIKLCKSGIKLHQNPIILQFTIC